MSERHEQSPEHSRSPEHSPELAEAAQEALKRIERSAEVVGEGAAEKLESAREAIERLEEKPAPEAEKEAPKKHHPTALDKIGSYWQTVHAMQRRLKPTSRAFSKVIHTPIIEKTSEVLDKTVMRPSVTLGAATTALIVGGFFYVTARRYGFPLTGSEFFFSLVVGGILGLVIELATKPFRRHK